MNEPQFLRFNIIHKQVMNAGGDLKKVAADWLILWYDKVIASNVREMFLAPSSGTTDNKFKVTQLLCLSLNYSQGVMKRFKYCNAFRKRMVQHEAPD